MFRCSLSYVFLFEGGDSFRVIILLTLYACQYISGNWLMIDLQLTTWHEVG